MSPRTVTRTEQAKADTHPDQTLSFSSSATALLHFASRRRSIFLQVSKLDIGENKTRVALVSLAGNGVPEIFLNDDYNKDTLIEKVRATVHVRRAEPQSPTAVFMCNINNGRGIESDDGLLKSNIV